MLSPFFLGHYLGVNIIVTTFGFDHDAFVTQRALVENSD